MDPSTRCHYVDSAAGKYCVESCGGICQGSLRRGTWPLVRDSTGVEVGHYSGLTQAVRVAPSVDAASQHLLAFGMHACMHFIVG